MTKTIRLTMAQALTRFLARQMTEIDGETLPLFGGVWAIFGHGNVAGIGEALYEYRDELPTFRAHNEQAMAHAAIAYAKANFRRRIMAATSSIGPGAVNMVTAAALAHVNRLPVLLLPGDVFANRIPDPVLQQVEDFGDGTVSANDCFRPVSRYFDRITRPEQIIPALARAMQVLTDPAECGPVTLSLCQDVQAEAYDYPESFFEPRVWTQRRPRPDLAELKRAADALKKAKKPLIIAGGGVLYSGASDQLAKFVEATGIPVCETQGGKSSLPDANALNMAAVGVTGTSAANRLAEEADVVLAVGTRLQDFTTGSWALFKNGDKTVIGLNVQPFDAGKHRALTLVGDARESLKELEKAIGGWKAPAAWTSNARKGKAEWQKAAAKVTAATNVALPSDAQVIGAVQRALGSGVIADQRLGRTARRVAQALAGRRTRLLSRRIWLLDHGLRDRRRSRHQDGQARPGSRRHARRRFLPDAEFGDRHLGDARPEAHHRAARQPRLRLHQPAADGHRRRQLQQSAEGRPPRGVARYRLRRACGKPRRDSRKRSRRSPTSKRHWARRGRTAARPSSSSIPTRWSRPRRAVPGGMSRFPK